MQPTHLAPPRGACHRPCHASRCCCSRWFMRLCPVPCSTLPPPLLSRVQSASSLPPLLPPPLPFLIAGDCLRACGCACSSACMQAILGAHVASPTVDAGPHMPTLLPLCPLSDVAVATFLRLGHRSARVPRRHCTWTSLPFRPRSPASSPSAYAVSLSPVVEDAKRPRH